MAADSWESICLWVSGGQRQWEWHRLLSLGCSVRVRKCCQAAEEGWGRPRGSALAGRFFAGPHPPGPLPGAMPGVQERSWPGSFSKESNLFFKRSNRKTGSFFSLVHHLEVMSFPAAPHSPARLPDT